VDGGGEAGLGTNGEVGGGEIFDEGFGGQVTGDLTGGCSAHAVADDESAGIEGGGAGVLVVLADPSWVGERCVDENGGNQYALRCTERKIHG
jgi:hypothetical protein